MLSRSREKAGDRSTSNPPNATIFTHIVAVPQSDRWRIYYRLQELKISCWCLPDGSLRVEVHDIVGILLLRSVVQQFVASRQEMVHWLERCWNTTLP